MRKLLVVLLALVVGVFLYAENVTVSWSGSAKFTLTVDENGADIDGSIDVDVTWAPSAFSAAAGKVSASFGLGFGGGASLSELTFDGELLKVSYVPGAASLGSYLFTGKDNDGDGYLDGVGSDYASFTLKAVDFLTVYYVDILDSEVNTNAGTPAEASYFDDFVGVTLSQDLGVFDLSAAGAFYDSDATNVSSAYEYGAEVSLEGAEALDGLSLWVGFGNSTASGTVYGVTASYKYSLDVDIVTVGVAPSVKYSEGLNTLVYSSFTDGKVVSAEVTVDVAVDPVTLGLEVTPEYDLEASTPLSVYFDATLGVKVDPVSASAEFEVPDVLTFADSWNVSGNVTVDVAPVSVAANVLYLNDGSFGYNASVSLAVEEGLDATVFYGTLFDADADGVANINTDAQWYAQLSYSVSF
ncbi:MAG: hypothetical protein J7L34_01130 [Thermotogaceae bacterium]|nr:hypothetical protein [Thermotogaceae bacterium]